MRVAEIASAIGGLNVLAARTQRTERHFVSEKKSGFSASFSTGISYGKSSLEQALDGKGQGESLRETCHPSSSRV